MKIPIEAIKGALWWMQDSLYNHDFDRREYDKTREYINQLTSFIASVDNNLVELGRIK